MGKFHLKQFDIGFLVGDFVGVATFGDVISAILLVAMLIPVFGLINMVMANDKSL